MRFTILTLLLLFSFKPVKAQNLTYDSIVHWTCSAQIIDSNTVEIVCKARIKQGWSIGQSSEVNSLLVPTTFVLMQNGLWVEQKNIRESGTKVLSKAIKELDGSIVYVYYEKAEFRFQVKRQKGSTFMLQGIIKGLCMSDDSAISNTGVPFSIKIPGS